MLELASPPTRTLGRRLFGDLSAFGDREAVLTATDTVTYRDLASRVADVAERLGTTRRLVLVAASNDLGSIVGYLAALSAGHTVLLVPGDNLDHQARWVADYDPDVILRSAADTVLIDEVRPGSTHDLHPELALLMSTSGSTGSPKLVRLSYANVRSNAEAIADYLRLTDGDRAITSLPLHYCYGLSVLNSHLTVGAGVVVTDLSVVDPCFWDLFARTDATSFAGVPYTFDLLDRSGFDERDLPSLRYVTQAGGRLAADRVRRYAEQGRRRGWDFFVMYGQTEATARMAYLPPDLAAEHPTTIGVPIPGGSLRIAPLDDRSGPRDATDDPAVGELVYAGPNVMMGYAETASDLALGSVTGDLHTGDLARRTQTGLFEIVGRRSRFAKVFGLRIDLDAVERRLAEEGVTATCVSAGDRLQVFVTADRDRDPERAAGLVSQLCGLPVGAVRATRLEHVPVTSSGKPDYASLEAHADVLDQTAQELAAAERIAAGRGRSGRTAVTVDGVRDLYATLLGRPDCTADSSFVSLAGDSLSYVELSVQLGDRLDRLPRDWHLLTISQLVETSVVATTDSRGLHDWAQLEGRGLQGLRRRISRWPGVETSVLLRGLAIVVIVGTHANLVTLYGGAHLLLALAGFNFARFQLARPTRSERVRSGFTAVALVAVPSTVIIGTIALATSSYTPTTTFFLNWALGSNSWDLQWQFWFLEALIWTLVAMIALIAVPAVDRFERRRPWPFALGVLGVGLLLRYGVVGIEAGTVERYEPAVVFWCFGLGWAIARADTVARRVVVSVATVGAVAGFFGEPEREGLIMAGLALLIWVPGLRVPRPVLAAVGTLAASSLYIYLTHWQVYPHWENTEPLLAVALSLFVGIVVARVATPLTQQATAAWVRHGGTPRPRMRRGRPTTDDQPARSPSRVGLRAVTSPADR